MAEHASYVFHSLANQLNVSLLLLKHFFVCTEAYQGLAGIKKSSSLLKLLSTNLFNVTVCSLTIFQTFNSKAKSNDKSQNQFWEKISSLIKLCKHLFSHFFWLKMFAFKFTLLEKTISISQSSFSWLFCFLILKSKQWFYSVFRFKKSASPKKKAALECQFS
jgi:hypothetical protein